MNAAQNEKADFDEVVSIGSETMVGDLMALTFDELKNARRSWQELSESQQDRVIERVENRVREAVRQVIYSISSQGFVRVPATLEQVVAKEGLKAVLIPAAHGVERHALFDSVGQSVTIVLANPSRFVDAPHGFKAEPNQRALDLDGTVAAVGAGTDVDNAEAVPAALPEGIASDEPFREFASVAEAGEHIRAVMTSTETGSLPDGYSLRCRVDGILCDVTFGDAPEGAERPLIATPVKLEAVTVAEGEEAAIEGDPAADFVESLEQAEAEAEAGAEPEAVN